MVDDIGFKCKNKVAQLMIAKLVLLNILNSHNKYFNAIMLQTKTTGSYNFAHMHKVHTMSYMATSVYFIAGP